MIVVHKNKTLATLLASTLGGAGLHRFYLRGRRDLWGWVHFAGLPLSLIGIALGHSLEPVFSILLIGPLILSALAAMLEALVLGLTPDLKWDAEYNANSTYHSDSKWPLALILVLTLSCGAGGLIFVIVRVIDLSLTGGSYG